MKFLAVVAAVSAVATVASAQLLMINNPTTGTDWVVGGQGYISWTGNCSNLGNASHSVGVNLVHGPATAVTWVADLTNIDCSGTNNTIFVTVPSVAPGSYSLQILTSPTDSYSNAFTIGGGASTTTAPAPPASTTTAPSGNGSGSAGNVVTAPLIAVAGCVALTVGQLLL